MSKDDDFNLYDIQARMPAGKIDARRKIDDLMYLAFDRLGEQLVAINKRAGVVSWSPQRQSSSYIFNARLLNVQTGRVIKGRQVIGEECRDQDIFDAITLLVSTIAR